MVNSIADSNTIVAIEEFQRRVVKISQTDGRVDPGGKTLKALDAAAGTVFPSPPVGLITVKFSHGNKQPTGVTGLPGASTSATATRYESSVTITASI